MYFQDSERRTPLHAAAHCGESECLSLLILNGTCSGMKQWTYLGWIVWWLSNTTFPDKYDRSMFSAVCRARTSSTLHVLEALCIKKLKSELCKQMEFVKCLDLFPTSSLVKIIHAHSCTITTTSHISYLHTHTCTFVVSPSCTPAF